MFSMFAGWKQMNVSKFIIFNHELYINRLGSMIRQSNSCDDDKFQRSILKMRFGNNLKTILDLFSYFYIWFFYIQLFVLRSLILSWKLVQCLVQNRTYRHHGKINLNENMAWSTLFFGNHAFFGHQLNSKNFERLRFDYVKSTINYMKRDEILESLLNLEFVSNWRHLSK